MAQPTTTTATIEQYLPYVKYNGGIATALPVYINNDITITGTASFAGSTFTDLTTTGNTVLGNGATDTLGVTGVSTFTAGATTKAVNVTGTAITTGEAIEITDLAALTSGIGIKVTSAATAITGAGRLIYSSHSGATTTSGILNEFTSANTDGTVVTKVTASGATTGKVLQASATATVSGVVVESLATAATLTTGRYFSANDAATEVFGIGANGHIHSKVSAAPPTIAVTTQAGITAAAITSGGTDTCGVITTTGTSTGATQLTVTFGKTYTTAPKTVMIAPANAAACMPNTAYFVDAITATTFRITVAAGGTYAATPSWYYQVIA